MRCCTSELWPKLHFSCCRAALTLSQGLLCSSHCPASLMAGRGHSQHRWPQWPKGCPIPYGIILSNKSWRKERGGGDTFRVMASVFLTNHYTWWAQLSWKWLNICLLMGITEWIPCFPLLARAALLYLSNCLYLNPCIFSLLPSQFSPHLAAGEWVSGCIGLNLTHNSPFWCLMQGISVLR